MTTPLPEARPLAWTARRASEFERLEGMAPARPKPPRAFAPLKTVARLLRLD